MPLLGGEGGGSGTSAIEAANYSALPPAGTAPGQTYIVLASQGTAWLPGSLGGTYYPKGYYYDNGTSYTYSETPYNASLATVNAGTNNDEFVTPYTFENAAKWATKQDAGNYIIALTGDVTATGPGSVIATLASIITAGTKGAADKTLTIQYDAKGRLLSVTENSIQITESQVTGLVSDLAGKQSTALAQNHILVGSAGGVATDVTMSGDATIVASGALTLASIIVAATKGGADKTLTITYDAKGRVTAATENTIAILASQVTDFNETAQDAVGNILTDSTTIDFTYNDASNTITAIVIDGSVTNAKLANMATQTFKGRTTAGTGSPEDLTKSQAQGILGLPSSSTDNQILRHDGTTGNIQGSPLTIDDNGGIITPGESSPAFTAKSIRYDNTLNQWIMTDNDSATMLNVGYETWFICLNNTGSSIPNGSVVYISGSSGGTPTIALAKADAASTAVGIGITTETIANGSTGKVTQSGLVNGVDTSALSAGAVYVSTTVAGGLTNTSPTSPNYRMRVGFVGVINATTGTILVTPSTAALGNGSAYQMLSINSAGTAQAFVNPPYSIFGFRKTGTATFERWYNGSMNCAGMSATAIALSSIRYFPFIVEKACTVDRIAAEITAGGTAGSLVRLGIYDSSNLLPNNLIVDAGTIAGDSATFQSITISQVLQPGLYFLTMNHNSAASPTFRTIPVGSMPPVLGFPNTGGATVGTYYTSATVFGTFTNPATAPNAIQSAVGVCIWLRLA